MKIGDKVITEIKDQLDELLHEKEPELNNAFLKSEGEVKVNASIVLEQSAKDENGVGVEVKISFGLGKVTAKAEKVVVNEIQRDLFSEK